MENLQLVLLILGAIAIIAVLVHGFWSIRKQQPKSLKEVSQKGCFTEKTDRDADGFDADGIGKVRVSKAKPRVSPNMNPVQRESKATRGRGQQSAVMTPTQEHRSSPQRTEPVGTGGRPVHRQEDVESAQVIASQNVASSQPEPLAEHQVDIEHLTEMPGISEPFPNEKRTPEKSIKEAPLKSRQVDTLAHQDALLFGYAEQEAEQEAEQGKQDVIAEGSQQQASLYSAASSQSQSQVLGSEHQSVNNTSKAQEALPQEQKEEVSETSEPQDVLVLHVTAKEGEIFNGAELLPCLLALNFKFGEMNIFHRHQDNAGKEQVLFSLANMVKPGVFNPDHMEQFNTQGVVLFMTLPCYGDALMNFSIMLNCAHQIADDLQGQVLDGGRERWLESTKQAYLQRIKNQLALSA
ncbi:cell division protein ZipA [uncultured Shewanella sp.]|uniref:cell division protein ZipA n=1 Tax=uncultured Shewanella sp. TaxID=173975 RepID=UPI00260C6DCF|nr:cell division protein ZipA [uncultured Shewanella sp.]